MVQIRRAIVAADSALLQKPKSWNKGQPGKQWLEKSSSSGGIGYFKKLNCQILCVLLHVLTSLISASQVIQSLMYHSSDVEQLLEVASLSSFWMAEVNFSTLTSFVCFLNLTFKLVIKFLKYVQISLNLISQPTNKKNHIYHLIELHVISGSILTHFSNSILKQSI